jgi:diguanylate cyclase (GGDEF)-like protein/PAS domain S-box-containing protein
MISFKRLSLRNKIALPIILSTLIAIISFEVYLHFGALESKKQNVVERVSALASGVAVNLSAAVVFNDDFGANEVLDAFSVDEDVVKVLVSVNNNKTFAKYHSSTISPEMFAPIITDNPRHDILTSFTDQYLYIQLPILLDREPVATMSIIVSLEQLNIEIQQIQLFGIFIFILTSMMGLLIIHKIQHLVISPVAELNQAMNQIIQGDNNISRPETTTDDELGELIDCFNTMLDKLQEREQQILTSMDRQKLAADVFENIRDGLVVIDRESTITMVNTAITKLFNYEASEVVGKKIHDILNWQEYPTLRQTIQDALFQYGHWQGEITEKSKSGENIPVFVRASLITIDNNPEANKVVFTITDIRSSKEVERLEHLAHYDYLTGLSNRAHLHQMLDRIYRHNMMTNQKFAVVYLDLDGFKLINDTFGHDAGDEVLTIVSKRLENQVRNHDIVARLAGDEFVLILDPIKSDKTVIDLAERLLININQPIEYQGTLLSIGASIGINRIDDYCNFKGDYGTLLKGADTAMYHSKSQGKGCYTLIHNSNRDMKKAKVVKIQ